MKTIIYVHGYASSGATGTAVILRNNLYQKDVKVLSPDLPVNPLEAIEFLKNFVAENNPDLIIGTSMGAMYTEQLRGFNRILVNPSFHMAKLITFGGLNKYQEFRNKREDGQTKFMVDKNLVDAFKKVEANTFKGITPDDKAIVYGLFGTKDKKVNCQPEFKKNYGNQNFALFEGEHFLNDEVLKKAVMPLVNKILAL